MQLNITITLMYCFNQVLLNFFQRPTTNKNFTFRTQEEILWYIAYIKYFGCGTLLSYEVRNLGPGL